MEQTTELSTVQKGPMNGVVAVEQQRSIAEVQAAVIMARQFPRDMVQAMQRIKMACQRPALAEVAVYSYARGGSDVSGPSIRLAEALAQTWGNIQFGIRELSQSNGESTVEAYAWDLESNVRQSKVFQVKHERHTRQGAKKLTDPRDIYELAANNGARRMRACILGILPGDVVESAVEECNRTMNTNVDMSEDKLNGMLKFFEGYGVTKAMVEKRIQRPMESVTPAQFVSLRKIANSMKDGVSKAADWFEIPTAPPAEAGPTRMSPKWMKDAQYAVEVQGTESADSILDANPNLPEDQKLLIRSWEFKGE